ncbi:MAG TPA: monovalent cation/H+ antiporter complex subunit F [Pseudonocardiaceae bacterium]|nr:monovalent cation/H+ antiporter complex subunit F [Pseudonocardiaceae bacterium]
MTTVWLVAAGVLLIGGVLPAGVVACRGSAPRRLVGLELASATAALLMLVLCQAFGQSGYLIVPLVLALLSFVGTLVYTRLLDTADD